MPKANTKTKPKVREDKLTPQQLEFIKNYMHKDSDTFGNALQSAIKSGYSEKYARQIVSRDLDWMLDIVRHDGMLVKAEKVLDDTLDVETVNTRIDSEGNQLVFTDPALLRVKTDVAKFVTSRIGKKKWSERRELTGSDGEQLFNAEKRQKAKDAIRRYLRGDSE